MSQVLDFWQAMSADWARVTGTTMMYAGPIAPSGYYFCDGSMKNRTTDAALCDAITAKFTCTTTTGSPILTNVSRDLSASLLLGQPISLPGVANGATVTALAITTVTVSVNATASANNVVARIMPWGVGDNSTTFALPDCRGEFPRGLDRGRGVDVNRKLGVAQGGTVVQLAANKVQSITGSDSVVAGGTGGAALSDDAGVSAVQHTVRIRNMAMNWIIKT